MLIFKHGPFPTLVAVVTTLHKEIVNATPITWFTPCSYEPPLLFMALKKDCDTLANIRDKQEFVLQTVPFEYAQEIHNLAAPCPRDKSELDDTSLSLMESRDIETPRLEIAQEWFECKLWKQFHMAGGHLSHVFVIGEVLGRYVSSHYDKLPLMTHGGLSYTNMGEEVTYVNPYKGDNDGK